jgi:4-hydroxy-4-methyl-2-oxoglutarate aldolase
MDISQRQELIELYRGLRVTDVSDGMDRVLLHDRGLVDRDIRPIYRDLEGFSHRIYGFAHTVRFVPTNRPITARTPEEMEEFIRN